MPFIFVYGTLKKGQSYHYLLRGCQGYRAIAPRIVLHAGPHYPFAIRGLGQAIGEIYNIHDALLQKLDELEDHPNDYHREITPVILANGNMIRAWIYLHKQACRYPRIRVDI